jgi:hypothetical protein
VEWGPHSGRACPTARLGCGPACPVLLHPPPTPARRARAHGQRTWFAAHAATDGRPRPPARRTGAKGRPAEGRKTELVFIGLGLDRARLAARLDKLLLTDSELAAGPEAWAGLPDPLQLAPLHAELEGGAAAPKAGKKGDATKGASKADSDQRGHGDRHGDRRGDGQGAPWSAGRADAGGCRHGHRAVSALFRVRA